MSTAALRHGRRASATCLFVAALALVACETRPRESSSAPHTAGARAAAPSASASAEPLAYVERCVGAPCDARLPTVLAIHGLGDTPEAFIGLYDGLERPARVVALRAPLRHGDGFAWFPYRSRVTDPATIAEALVAQVPRVLATLDALCARRACDGRTVVTGFSQGGMMSYALAARAPERFLLAAPVGGFLVPGVEPRIVRPSPAIVAFHGEADVVVSARWDQEGVERLRSLGFEVRLTFAPGVGHTIPPGA